MKAIVIYHSQTGFTERYARWIATELKADCLPFSAAKNLKHEEYDTIIFGGWAKAGSIVGLSWFKKNLPLWLTSKKKVICYCVGASPIENPDLDNQLNNLFTVEERAKIGLFYCPGGLNYRKMSKGNAFMMKLLIRVMKLKKHRTEEDEEKIRMISSSYDLSDKKYIEPILAYCRQA